MSKLLSIIIPTRKRAERLLRTLDSIRQTASSENYDVWLRIDNDDEETVDALENIAELVDDLHVLAGPRGKGWSDIPKWMNEICQQTDAEWVWGMNDDALVSGQGWDNLLSGVPTAGFVAQPEFHQLGGSLYPRDAGSPFAIYPNRCWEKIGWTELKDCFDTALSAGLKNIGWHTAFLVGMKVWHQRDTEDVLARHRL